MSQSSRKAAAELTKLWESMIAKGKNGSGVQDLKKWLPESPPVINQQVDRLQKPAGEISQSSPLSSPSDLVIVEETMKVGELMAAYEELTGIGEVRSAHEEVLSTEAKFIECQEQRRDAYQRLLDIQNTLAEIRAQLEHTHKTDEPYLDLIKKALKKKEIAVAVEERIIRETLNDWERTEREMFSDLSNALRFSQEKERAQSEKTKKYWSILGSVVGAGLGILGMTINNIMKQNQQEELPNQGETNEEALQLGCENAARAYLVQNFPIPGHNEAYYAR